MYDLKIVNAAVNPGVGGEGQPGSVAVKNGRIAELAEAVSGPAEREIDAGGHILCPGFIDLHTHCGAGHNQNMLQQGVTLAVTGNCGFSALDPAARFGEEPMGLNLATLVGHHSVREAVIGNIDRPPERAELTEMKRLVGAAMDEGAFGLSTGLAYTPGSYADTEEIIELARVAAERDGFYATHLRNQAERSEGALEEAFRIGREAGMPVHVSHFKLVGAPHWDLCASSLATITKQRSEGLDVTLDQYPYTAACGTLFLMLPEWSREGGREDVLRRLATREARSRIREFVMARFENYYQRDGANVVIAICKHDPNLEGKSIAQITAQWGRPADVPNWADTVLELAEANPQERMQTMCVYHSMCEENVIEIMKDPYTAIGSDAWGTEFGESRPHPRLYGSFPRALGRYAREQGVLSMPEAIRKMTSLPAQRLGLEDRGVLKVGAWADLVLFDEDVVADQATWSDPHRYCTGMELVVVNGRVVMDHGEPTGEMPGRFVARPGSPQS